MVARRPLSPLRTQTHRAVASVAAAALALSAGVGLGAAATALVPAVQRHALDVYLGTFFHGAAAGAIHLSSAAVFWRSFGLDLRTVAICWVAGLFALGAPVVLAALFVRGFAVGFTVGFLMVEGGWGGLALAALTVVPGSLIAVPVLVGVGAVSTAFSMRNLLSWLGRVPRPVRRELGAYAFAGAAAVVALAVAGAVDGYLVPGLIRIVGPHIGL